MVGIEIALFRVQNSINKGKIAMDALMLGGKNSLNLENNILLDDDNIQPSDSGTEFKEFLSSILLNVKNSSDNSEETLLNAKIALDKHNQTIDKIDPKKDYNKISVDELLQFVSYLKSSSLKGNFPTDKKKLNDILHDKQALNDFKNITNIKELFEVAKKYDIKITKFDISLEQDIDNNIVSSKDIQKYLSKTQTMLKDQISSETILHFSKIKNNKNSKTKDNTEHTLRNILNSTKPTINIKESFKQEKILSADKKTTDQKHIKVEKYSLESINNKQEIQSKPLDKSLTKAMLEQEDKIIYQTHKKENLHKKIAQLSQQQDIKTENVKNNKPHITRKNDIKIISNSNIKESFKQEKILSADKKTIDQKHTKVEKHSLESIKQKSTIQENKANPIENKNISNSFPNHLHTDKTKTVSNTLSKHLNPKPTLEQFANDLKNEIQNYKPPIARVKMTLNPKDLGSVDVSIISRGNNLQININANNNTMAIFTQNQAEFKNALVNMGFTNLNMNFNSNSNSQNKQQNKNGNKESQSFEELSENEVERTQTISLSMPRYI